MSKGQLFEVIRYAIYCHFFEFDPSDLDVYFDYLQFWESDGIKEHFGDCTNQPTPCLKCQAEWIDGDAKKAFEAVNVTIPFKEIPSEQLQR